MSRPEESGRYQKFVYYSLMSTALPPARVQPQHAPLSVFMLAMALITGCASGSAGIEPDAGSRHDGSTARDSGDVVLDGETRDSGSMPRDSGGVLVDAGGTTAFDAGTIAFDAGRDGGTIALDAGRDAGTALDAGGLPCTGTPWGTVNHGFSGVAYLASTPTGPCISQMRVCSNGTMSGSYTSTSCQAGCTGTPWGNVASGFSGTAYSHVNAPFGMTCARISQTRTCTNGSMSGSYANTSCTQYPCEHAGIHFRVGSAGYNRGTFSRGEPDPPASQFTECQPDGTWSAWMTGNPISLGTPCEWETSPGQFVYVQPMTCGYNRATGQRYRCGSDGMIVDGAASCPPGP